MWCNCYIYCCSSDTILDHIWRCRNTLGRSIIRITVAGLSLLRLTGFVSLSLGQSISWYSTACTSWLDVRVASIHPLQLLRPAKISSAICRNIALLFLTHRLLLHYPHFTLISLTQICKHTLYTAPRYRTMLPYEFAILHIVSLWTKRS